MWEEEDLIVDVMMMQKEVEVGGGGRRETMLWVAMPKALAYAKIGGGGGGGGERQMLTRVWTAAPGVEDSRLLFPKGTSKEGIRRHLVGLHHRRGGWVEAIRHIESSFLRVISVPWRFSPMALLKAVERMRTSPPLSRPGNRLTDDGNEGRSEVPISGEKLWELIASVVRSEADRTIGKSTHINASSSD